MRLNLWTMDSFRHDLKQFIACLDKHAIKVERYTLDTLLHQIHKRQDFDITLPDLVFRIDKKISGTNPNEVGRYVISLSHECCLDAARHQAKTQDHITRFAFDIYIRAFVGSKEHHFAWHLDQQIPSATTKTTHPVYHFQAGGSAIENVNSGDLVILGAPRIPHPPMDIFLGVHFVLNNFYSTTDYPEVKRLFNDDDYLDVLRNSQTRMWASYFTAYAPGVPQHQFYTRKSVFPLHVD